MMPFQSVGAVEIDSGWSTGYNNFIVDKSKFPDMPSLVQEAHNDDVRVLLWATSMVDEKSSNYQELLDNKYYILNGVNGTSTLHWWHGTGLLLDYFNPDAVEWFHKQMDNVSNLELI
jgi:alpha-glucosidase (family GH31 glycosyl hydrolase)